MDIYGYICIYAHVFQYTYVYAYMYVYIYLFRHISVQNEHLFQASTGKEQIKFPRGNNIS